MADWRIRHRDHNYNLLHTFKPENLNFSINLDEPHEIDYQISLANPIIQEENTAEGDPFGAYQTDWELLRDGVVLQNRMGGMMTNMHIPEGEEYVQCHGKSWLHYLEKRHYPSDPQDPHPYLFRAFNTDVDDIIGDILQAVLSKPYSMPLAIGTIGTPFKENLRIEFADTEDILSKIKTLAEGKPGFDYDVLHYGNGNMLLNLYFPEYKNPANIAWNFIVDAPDTATQSKAFRHLDWTDNGPQGTHILATGAGLAYKMGVARGSVDGQQTFRRLDWAEDFGQVANKTKMTRIADGALRAGVRPQREVPIEVTPENVPDFWEIIEPGVYIRAQAPLGAHILTGEKKVTSIECNVTNEGEELVTLHSTLWKAWYNVDNVETQV